VEGSLASEDPLPMTRPNLVLFFGGLVEVDIFNEPNVYLERNWECNMLMQM